MTRAGSYFSLPKSSRRSIRKLARQMRKKQWEVVEMAVKNLAEAQKAK